MQPISKAQIKWIRSLQQKKFRDAEGVFVAEGAKCIGELMGAFELQLLVGTESVLSRGSLVGLPWVSRGSSMTFVASSVEIEQMSNMRTPQGCIAVFKKATSRDLSEATSSNLSSSAATSSLILALDGIQDPGNLGTIIRTCDWFGVRDIYCSRETTDCYNPKVVQATMGALARVRIHYVELVEWLTKQSTINNQQSTINIYGTLLDGRNMYVPDAIPDKSHGIIIMGNEGNGISPAVRPFITHPLYIPSFSNTMPINQTTPPPSKGEVGRGSVESLNVSIATAITLAEFRRP